MAQEQKTLKHLHKSTDDRAKTNNRPPNRSWKQTLAFLSLGIEGSRDGFSIAASPPRGQSFLPRRTPSKSPSRIYLRGQQKAWGTPNDFLDPFGFLFFFSGGKRLLQARETSRLFEGKNAAGQNTGEGQTGTSLVWKDEQARQPHAWPGPGRATFMKKTVAYHCRPETKFEGPKRTRICPVLLTFVSSFRSVEVGASFTGGLATGGGAFAVPC